MALIASALLVMVCLYSRKLYEYTEFGKADTKLELMSNIMLSDSPTDSQASGSRHGHYGSAMSILPGIIGNSFEFFSSYSLKTTVLNVNLL